MFKLCAIVLAAGHSSRMGRTKALLRFKGVSFWEYICRSLAQAGIRDIVVVVNSGWRAESAAEAVKAPVTLESEVKWAVNPHPESGQLSSLLTAMAQLPAGSEAIMLCLVDHPAIRPDTYAQLARESAGNPGKIIVPVYQGDRGHPVIFPARFFAALHAVPEGQGARHVVYHNEPDIREIEVTDPGVRKDIDTPEDYEVLAGN